jgi:CHASE2 domain-containing sensor protein
MNGEGMADLVRGRAVILGVAAESFQDYFETPFSTGFNAAEPTWGIAIHAHLADQLIRQALDGTPSLYGLSRPLENVWIGGWALAGVLLGAALRSRGWAILSLAGAWLLLWAGVYVSFGAALLLPAAPAGIAWSGLVASAAWEIRSAHRRERARLTDLG